MPDKVADVPWMTCSCGNAWLSPLYLVAKDKPEVVEPPGDIELVWWCQSCQSAWRWNHALASTGAPIGWQKIIKYTSTEAFRSIQPRLTAGQPLV